MGIIDYIKEKISQAGKKIDEEVKQFNDMGGWSNAG